MRTFYNRSIYLYLHIHSHNSSFYSAEAVVEEDMDEAEEEDVGLSRVDPAHLMR